MKNPIAQLMLTPESLKQKTRETLLRSFSAFCRAAWKQIEPKGLEWNWHHELWCEHLQLMFERQELRLIFTTPPRTLKSRLISVLWPAWCWARDPSLSFLCTSYSDGLSEELSLLRRNLLASGWFQDLFPGVVQFDPDQNQKWKYQNTAHGSMFSTSMQGTALGAGCDFLVVDDPMSSEMSYSDAERGNVLRSFDGTFRSRLNESERGGIVIICQRLHEMDLVGHLLTNEPGVWTHVNLPMVAETDQEVIFPLSGRVLNRKAGDLLHPSKFSRRWCEKQRATIGTYLWSSQYLQRPGVLGGAVFRRGWFRQYSELPQEKKGLTILSLDTAFSTKKSADYSVGTIWTSFGTGFFLRYVWRERAAYPHLRAMTEALAEDFAVEAVLVEEKGSGQSLLQSLMQETSLPIVGIQVDTDKVSRAHGVSALFESGRVFFPKDEPWMPTYLHELELFPSGAHDDCVDSSTMALAYLRSRTYSGGVLGLVKLMQKFDKFGFAKPKTLEARAENAKKWLQKCPPCPLCKSESTRWKPSTTDVILCDCGAENGILPPKPAGQCCADYLPQVISGGTRCGNCGAQSNAGAVIAGATFAELNARRSAPFHGIFDRVGRRG